MHFSQIERALSGNTEAAFQDIWPKWIFQIDNRPNHTAKIVTMCLKVLEWRSQNSDLSSIENLMVKPAYRTYPVTPGLRRNGPNLQ